MKKLFSILFALVLVLSFSLVTAVPVGAQDGSYLGTPPTIDGVLSEWEATGTQYVYADGCLGGEQIGTGKLYMAFDDDNFYLAYKLEDAGEGDDYLYAFNGGFWFPDASAYDSSGPPDGIFPSEHVLTDTVLELRQSWSGVRGAEAVYGEWMVEIVSNNAARIIRLGNMQETSGDVTALDFYAGSYDGEEPFPGSYIMDGVDKDGWIMTGFSALDLHFGQYSVTSPKQPPIADAGGPYSVDEGSIVTLDGTGSSDPDGTIASYSWATTDDSTGEATLTDSDTSTPVFNAPSVDSDTDMTVELTVTDNDGATDSDTATVTVKNVPVGPPPVGGIVYPNNLALLAPWIGLGLVMIVGAIIFLRRRRAWS